MTLERYSPPAKFWACILIRLGSDDVLSAQTANLILGEEVFSDPASRDEIMAEAMSQDSELARIIRCYLVIVAKAAGVILSHGETQGPESPATEAERTPETP